MSLKGKNDSTSIKQLIAFEDGRNQYFLNWHLDLEVLPLLPYKKNAIFKINFYDPGLTILPSYEIYKVTGTGILNGYDNQKVECWLLMHADNTIGHETFWISKQTGEVLKLQEEYLGKCRYQIKLAFSK